MRKYADLAATVGEYRDERGRTRKRRVAVGAIFRDDTSGRMSIKIDLLPVAGGWSGWLSVATKDDATHGEDP